MMSACDYCGLEHPNGVTDELRTKGHPYLVGDGRGLFMTRSNETPYERVPECGAEHDEETCTISQGHESFGTPHRSFSQRKWSCE
jgi:hypothetical protein